MARIIDAFTQFFDDNGDPLVDGFLKFVESGTNNTDKDTFADINETIANANPVPLDGAGRCPNVFGTGSYNVISYTDAMVQIQQFDPVGADAATGAFVSWDSATIYDDGALVTGSDGLYYRSISANNQNQDPLTSPGQWEEVKFIGIWNTNITYAAGDSVYGSDGFLYMSRTDGNSGNDPISDTTNWRPGAEIQFTKGADLTTSDVTAGALALGTDGNYFDFTGTDTITSIDTVGVGAIVKIHFDAAATLTHDATDLFLPGGANITTAAGDEAELFEYAAGDWRCTSYSKADGKAVIESVTANNFIAMSHSGTGEVATTTTQIPLDDSIPQNTEGAEVMTLAHTPADSANILIIEAVAYMSNTVGGQSILALFQDSTADALAAGISMDDIDDTAPAVIRYRMVAGTASEITFKARVGPGAASTLTFNGNGGTRLFGGVISSSITVTETLP